MPLSDLRDFIRHLESSSDLIRIQAEVDPRLEIAAITGRVCKQPEGGRALLFQHPKGSAFPVITNLFGSLNRTCMALGVDQPGRLTTKLSALLDQIPGLDLTLLDRRIAALEDFSMFAPVRCSPYWTEIMQPPDLTAFPFLQSWPGDGAADGHPCYITLPQVVTAGPDGANPNCGLYRAQVRGKRELALRWKAGSGAARHLEQFRQLGRPMPVAISLGGPPPVLFSAMLPLPGDLDEMTFAGFMRGESIEMAACRTVPLLVPAAAEVVIEGFVDPADTVLEGPFGNHTGSYSPAAPASLLRVTSVSHRPGAMIPATPLENPDPGMVREIAAALWNTPWFKDARLTVFVAADGVPADERDIAWRCINLTKFEHDLFHDLTGRRSALDATGCRLPRHSLRDDPAMEHQVQQRWHEYGIPLK
ncbi:MAG: UbiD family decarboxylase [Geobacteraceae bacterium]|nr:UbiD family decarboxylase [Geobacteraceae bacterium]